MSIFIASTKPISRSNGQSAVASASYRAGCELEDKRYGKTHDYSKRSGVMSADIILPTALKEQGVNIERSELWNLAEESETRKNSRVAREWLINLPHKLNEQDRKELAHKFTQSLADKFGVIADCAIHKPTAREIKRGADARNFHAHIMLTTRKAELGEDGKITLTDKSDCELSDTQRKAKGLSKAKDEVTEIRELWEHIANEKLAEYGYDLIDSRSYAAQGIDIIPQEKMGSVATKIERDNYERELKKAEQAAKQGKVYEIDEKPTTIRGEVNRLIAERNSEVWNAQLADNQKVNDAADAIIIKGHNIEHTTPPPQLIGGDQSPKPSTKAAAVDEPKRKTHSPTDIAAAMALAMNVRKELADDEKQKEITLEQQRQREIAEQNKREQVERERIEQQRADRERAQQQERQAQAERLERENKQFTVDKKQMYGSVLAQTAEQNIKGIDKEKPAGTAILAISAANEIMHKLNDYINEPRTTQIQRELAKVERSDLTDFVSDKSKQALSEIKNLYRTDDRKTHTEALQTALNDFVGNHSETADKTQQKVLQSAQRDVTSFSNEINRSHSYGMGM
ncbi:MobA/MobL family protein [Psychrobacter namhaensis]|uniref:MobA/MobL family protein n=1 Tax=Psychrobacter namhaensis TaxID=292734 RepID=UPI003CFCBD01